MYLEKFGRQGDCLKKNLRNYAILVVRIMDALREVSTVLLLIYAIEFLRLRDYLCQNYF